MGRPPTNLPRVTFRFPDELRGQLEDAARAAGRSVNAEVVARLEASFAEALSPDEQIADLQRGQALLQKEVFYLHTGMRTMMEAIEKGDAKALFDQIENMMVMPEHVKPISDQAKTKRQADEGTKL